MPDLVRVGQQAKARGVTLIAIDAAEPRDVAEQFLNQHGYTSLPVALDPNGDITSTYRIIQFPTHVFINSDGTIQEVQLKPMNADQMRSAITQLR
jgi:hypothetical protein